jgi:hypothetical protein
MNIRGRQVALFVAVGTLWVSALVVVSAQAKQARLFSGSFGAATSMLPDPYPLSSASSVAVDASAGSSRGDIYVADPEDHRVEKFDSAGHLILMFGKAVNKTKVEEAKPEVEQNVCLSTETCQPGAASTPGAFHTDKLYAAVDSSAGSSAGDVYLADGNRITKFDEHGGVIASWANAGQLMGAGTPEVAFVEIRGIAVDSSGNLWVIESRVPVGGAAGTVHAFEFTSSAGLIASWQAPPALDTADTPATNGDLTVDSGDHLYFVEEDGDTAEWNSTGDKVGTITSRLINPDTGEFTPNPGGAYFQPFAFTRDPTSGDIYQGGPFPAFASLGSESPIIRSFAADSCKPVGEEHLCRTEETFGLGRLPHEGFTLYIGRGLSLAVDPTTSLDTLYAAYGLSQGGVIGFSVETVPDPSTSKATDLNGVSARLNGTVNPSGLPLTKCFFEWSEGEGPYEHEAPCEAPDATGVGSGSSPVEVHAQISGLTASKTYHFRLVASNSNTDVAEEPSRGQDLAFGPPRVLSTSALGVSATSATLQTELNAVNVETHYHFEYDTKPYGENEAPHGISVPVPDASAGSDAAIVPGSQQVDGLTPSTVYYYRVVAANTLGTVVGSGGSFTTQSAISGPPLLDDRVWEMVSPLEKAGSLIRGGEDPEGVLQASADGSGFAYTAIGPFGQEADSSRSFLESQFLAFRGVTGWSTKDISTPREDVVGVNLGNTEGYKAFSQDLSVGAVQPRGVTLLSPLATAATPYLRLANGEFLPLVDELNVPSETIFDGKLNNQGLVENEPEIVGGSSDLNTVVVASCFKLTEDAVNSCAKKLKSLYVWHDGTLQLSSILPDNKPAVSTGGESELGQLNSFWPKRHAVSDGGTRLAFSTSGNHLYLRDTALAKTVQLDQPEPGAVVGHPAARFEDMSADGSKVFFTDSERLAKNSNADNSSPDLYMCEIIVQGENLNCVLKDLTVARNVGEPGAVLGSSLGVDSSGRYVYFVANGALTPNASPGNCDAGGTSTGTCGLYLYDTVTGSVRLVATLSSADYMDWGRGEEGLLTALNARVSPNGRFVAFVSQRSLTGYDNRDAVSGQLDIEIYLYDRLGDGGKGKLVCVSCDPTGARPHGVDIAENQTSRNKGEFWRPGTWVAAMIPGWTPYALFETSYQSRYLSDSGRLFFDSVDALVPRDSDGTTDVYEFESPQSEGQTASNNCTISSPTYSAQSDGCVDLVSPGTSPEESVFLDASESGDDVFFLTGSQIVPGDVDTALDIYDARVGGAVSKPVKPPACEGDACQNPVSAPDDPTPGSLTFQGPGNPGPTVSVAVNGKAKRSGRSLSLARALKACARKPKRKRARCERRARRTYGAVGKAKKSNRKAHR